MNKKYLNPLNKIHKFHETIRAREGVGRLLLSRARSKSDCRGRTPRRSLEEKTNLGWGPNERANGSYLSVRPSTALLCSTPVSIITARDEDDDNCTEIRSDLPSSECSSTNPRKRNLPLLIPSLHAPSLVSLGCPAFEHILTLSPHSETGQVKTNSEGRAGHSPFAMALGRFSRLCGIYGR